MKPKNERYTVAVDFDGVIHRYDSPWINAQTIPDGAVEGAIEWLASTIQSMDVVIFSTRCKTWRGRRAVRAWLKREAGHLWWDSPAAFYGLEDVKLSYEKPPALIYLDDRAVRFEGTFPTIQQIHAAKPWNKRTRTALPEQESARPETAIEVKRDRAAIRLLHEAFRQAIKHGGKNMEMHVGDVVHLLDEFANGKMDDRLDPSDDSVTGPHFPMGIQ